MLPRALEYVVACSDLEDDRHVTTGADRDPEHRHVHVQERIRMLVDAEAIVVLALHPWAQLDDELDELEITHRVRPKQIANVDDADPPKLEMIAEYRGRTTDDLVGGQSSEGDLVIRDEPVTSLQERQGALALADPTWAE